MNKKGFTLIELIAVITLFSIISLLVFGALTGSIKSASVKEMEVYKDNVSRAAQVYVETNLENYTLDSPGKYIVLKGAKIIEAGYLDKSIKNPSSCSIEEVNIRIYMESDYTLSYAVYCDGEEPPLSGDAEEIVPPEEPETPVTPSQTLYLFEYTGSVQEVTLPAGKWKLEVWGASGGGSTVVANSEGGKGGYSKGIIQLTTATDLYIYVGGRGTNDDGSYTSKFELSGGYNGGGFGLSWSGTQHNGGGGGGATDIRVGQDSLYARVIVAGGGGGGSDDGIGGYGGGITAGIGNSTFTAAQLDKGHSFGNGQNTPYTGGEAGGGGGGWYGGLAGNDENIPGSGGSGWVYTADNFSAWQTGKPTDAANWLLSDSYYLTDASTIAGNELFLGPDEIEATGHTGNGYARITWVSN